MPLGSAVNGVRHGGQSDMCQRRGTPLLTACTPVCAPACREVVHLQRLMYSTQAAASARVTRATAEAVPDAAAASPGDVPLIGAVRSIVTTVQTAAAAAAARRRSTGTVRATLNSYLGCAAAPEVGARAGTAAPQAAAAGADSPAQPGTPAAAAAEVPAAATGAEGSAASDSQHQAVQLSGATSTDSTWYTARSEGSSATAAAADPEAALGEGACAAEREEVPSTPTSPDSLREQLEEAWMEVAELHAEVGLGLGWAGLGGAARV